MGRVRGEKMGIFRQFPYSNFHEINLDWLIREWLNYKSEMNLHFANLSAEVTALKEYVENYFDNLDIQDEINNKIDEMVEDGTFEILLGRYLASASRASVFNDHAGLWSGAKLVEPDADHIVPAAFSSDGDLLYIIWGSNTSQTSVIQKMQYIDETTIVALDTSIGLDVKHPNSMTLKDNELYIIDSDDQCIKVVSLSDWSVYSIELDINVSSITYQALHGFAILGTAAGNNIIAYYNDDFTEKYDQFILEYERYTRQDMMSDEYFIYSLRYDPNMVIVFDWYGNTVKYIMLPMMEECEAITYCHNLYLIGYYKRNNSYWKIANIRNDRSRPGVGTLSSRMLTQMVVVYNSNTRNADGVFKSYKRNLARELIIVWRLSGGKAKISTVMSGLGTALELSALNIGDAGTNVYMEELSITLTDTGFTFNNAHVMGFILNEDKNDIASVVSRDNVSHPNNMPYIERVYCVYGTFYNSPE